MFLLARGQAEAMLVFIDRVPAIGPEMLARVARELADSGPLTVLLGPLSGTPYKVYAVQAGAMGTGLGVFLLISVPARLIRFVLVCLLTTGVSRLLQSSTDPRQRHLILASVWLLFYAIYFVRMSG